VPPLTSPMLVTRIPVDDNADCDSTSLPVRQIPSRRVLWAEFKWRAAWRI